MYVHHGCHNLNTDSIHGQPSYATDKGWMVSSWDDPAETPMRLPDGRLVILMENGKITELTEG